MKLSDICNCEAVVTLNEKQLAVIKGGSSDSGGYPPIYEEEEEE